MKEFLKPSWKKFLLFIVLITVFSIIPISLGVTDIKNDKIIITIGRGLPLPFYMQDFDNGENFQGSFWYYNWLLIDLIFWYFISSLVIHLFFRGHKKGS